MTEWERQKKIINDFDWHKLPDDVIMAISFMVKNAEPKEDKVLVDRKDLKTLIAMCDNLCSNISDMPCGCEGCEYNDYINVEGCPTCILMNKLSKL